jgi:hypothetical protein
LNGFALVQVLFQGRGLYGSGAVDFIPYGVIVFLAKGKIPTGAQQVPFYAFYGFDEVVYGLALRIAKQYDFPPSVEGRLQMNNRQHGEIAIDL